MKLVIHSSRNLKLESNQNIIIFYLRVNHQKIQHLHARSRTLQCRRPCFFCSLISQYFEMKTLHSCKCAMLQTVEQEQNVLNVFRNA